MEQVTSLGKIALGYVQVVSTLAVNLPSVPWPGALTGAWEAVAVVNIDVFSAFSVDCFASDIDFTHTFISTITYPAVFLLLVVLVTWYRSANAPGETEEEQEERYEMVTQGWKVGLFFVFLVYPSVSSTVLKMWHCRSIEGTWYLYADYRITCDGDWNTYAAIAGVAFVVYPLGVPLTFFYLLRSQQEALHDESHPDFPHVSARLSFLYRSYEPQAWYWEVVMLMQKLLLTGLLIFIRPQTSTQLVAGFAISIFFFLLHIKTNAYVEDLEDELQFCAMLSVTLTLFGGLGLKATSEIPSEEQTAYEQGLMAFILIAINLGVVLLAAYQIVLTFKKPPEGNGQAALQRKVCVKIFDSALTQNQDVVAKACRTISPENAETLAPVLTDALRRMAKQVPAALNAMKDPAKVYDGLMSMNSGPTDGMGMLDQFLRLGTWVVGKPKAADLFKPYVEVVVAQVGDHFLALGAPTDMADQLQMLVPGLCMFLVGRGLSGFVEDVMRLLMVDDLDKLRIQMTTLAEDIRAANESDISRGEEDDIRFASSPPMKASMSDAVEGTSAEMAVFGESGADSKQIMAIPTVSLPEKGRDRGCC